MNKAGWTVFICQIRSCLWDAYIKYKVNGYMPLRGLAMKYKRLEDDGATQWKEPEFPLEEAVCRRAHQLEISTVDFLSEN